DGDAASARDLARFRLELAGDEAEERRLAGAVRPDETDVLAGVYLPGQAGEELFAGISECNIGELNEHAGPAIFSMASSEKPIWPAAGRGATPALRRPKRVASRFVRPSAISAGWQLLWQFV